MTAASHSLVSEYVLAEPGSLERRSRQLSPLPRGWVRVRFLYCGLCGSDLSKFEGRREISYPVSLGHEFIAEVIAVGAEIDRLVPGDIVTSDLNYRCRACDQCQAGRSHLCRKGGTGLFTNRGFAEVADLHLDYLIPLKAPLRQLALTEPLSCVLHAKAWASPSSLDRVLVVGAGGLGICMVFALMQDPAVSFDVVELLPSRSSLIDEIIRGEGRTMEEPHGQYDVVFDLSGSESGLLAACTHVKPGGRLCSMSHLDGYSSCDFLLPSLTRRDVTFTVSYLNGDGETLKTASDMLEQQWSSGWERAVEVVALEELELAFEKRRTSPFCKTLIQITTP